MFDFHPDKNGDDHATEIFQFINASRSWFLCGADAVEMRRLERQRPTEKNSAFACAQAAARRRNAERAVAIRRAKEIEQEAQQRLAAEETRRFAAELSQALQHAQQEMNERDAREAEDLRTKAACAKEELTKAEVHARCTRRDR